MKRKLKVAFVILAGFPLILSAQTNSDYTIKGKLKKIKDTIQWVFLNYTNNNLRVTDSVAITNDQYSFNGKLTQALKATLTAKHFSSSTLNITPAETDIITFFVEPGEINITSTGSFSNASIKAGKANKDFAILQNQLKSFDQKQEQLSKDYEEATKNKDKVKSTIIDREINELDSVMLEDVYGSFARKNLNSPIELYALQSYAKYDFRNSEKVEPIFYQLPPNIQDLDAARIFKQRMEIAKKLKPGMMAFDFTQSDTSGNPITLSSFKGKYVLLNFWASWCPHCRRNNPRLVELFKKYQDKPFTILSVSVDRPGQKEMWLKAIRESHLTWTHVSDLKALDNAVAKQYGVTGIPQNFLIDPEGRIIARNLMNERLENKVEEIFAHISQ